MGTEPDDRPRATIHPDVRREHVIKLAAAANATRSMTAHLVYPNEEMSARFSLARSGQATEVTVTLFQGSPWFAWTTDHGLIREIEDIAGTLGAVRHALDKQGQPCQP